MLDGDRFCRGGSETRPYDGRLKTTGRYVGCAIDEFLGVLCGLGERPCRILCDLFGGHAA